MTPEDRGHSATIQDRMTRWPRVDNLEQARLNRAWEMVERKGRTVAEARDALLIKAKRGAIMTKKVDEVMTGIKESYCTGCRGGGRFQDREQFWSMTREHLPLRVSMDIWHPRDHNQYEKRRSQWR